MPAADPHLCPACNRFIEDHLECPYCGSDSSRRSFLRALQLVATILAGVGLLLLGLLTQHTPPPQINLTVIRPGMNHALVTVAGTITSAPLLIHPPQGCSSFAFELSDGSGIITVTGKAGPPGDLPARNDRVQATGRLHLVAGTVPRLYLDPASSLIKL